MTYPSYVKNCIEMLERSGYSAYAVGGAVRDSLLGTEPNDWDVTTSATPDDVLSVFASFKTVPTGIKHGTVTVIFDENGTRYPIEITTYRIDGDYRDSRHPESVCFSKDVRDDLSRRDFTVNAMAYNEQDGLIDIFGGQRDLEQGIIRTVGDAETRFREDALRILRAFRFAAQLDFEIEERTLFAAKKCASLLKNVARERIFAELKRLFASKGALYSVQKMCQLDIWAQIFDVLPPPNNIIEKIALAPSGSFAPRFAVLLSAYTETERESIIVSLRPSNDEKKTLLRLCKIWDFPCPQENISKLARHFLHLYNNILPDALDTLRVWMEANDFTAFKNAVLSEQTLKRPLRIADLKIKGEDLLPLCNGNRALVGKTLNALLALVIDSPDLNEKEKLINIARDLM